MVWRWPINISTSTPVVFQQFGDKATVEHALVLQVQREIIHQTLQEGLSCRQQSLLFPDTPEIYTQVEQDCEVKVCVVSKYLSILIYPNYSVKTGQCDFTYPCRILMQRGIWEWVRAAWGLQPEQPVRTLHREALCSTENKTQPTHKTSSIQLQKTNCLSSLPANGTTHSVSTACPASSTNTWVKWPSGMSPETSLQGSECRHVSKQKFTCTIDH